jgi:hypothetical protein
VSRFTIIKNGSSLWAWDSKLRTMYQRDPEAEIGIKRPVTIMMLSKFAPEGKLIEETNTPPTWIPKL